MRVGVGLRIEGRLLGVQAGRVDGRSRPAGCLELRSRDSSIPMPAGSGEASLWKRVARDGWSVATRRSAASGAACGLLSSACAATTPAQSRSSSPASGSTCSCATGWPETSCWAASGSPGPMAGESGQACRLPDDVPTYAVPPCAATHVMVPCPAASVATVAAFAAFAASVTALASENWRRTRMPRSAACSRAAALECRWLAGSTSSNTLSTSVGLFASSVCRVASGLVSALAARPAIQPRTRPPGPGNRSRLAGKGQPA